MYVCTQQRFGEGRDIFYIRMNSQFIFCFKIPMGLKIETLQQSYLKSNFNFFHMKRCNGSISRTFCAFEESLKFND